MAKALLSPKYGSESQQLAGTKLFAKQILPFGTINYKGRKLTFDKAYATDLANAFAQKAFPSLDFMMADVDNKHTMDPERWRGNFQALEVRSDGLYGYLKPRNEETAQLLRDNPNLQVSGRIIEDLTREDGQGGQKHFKRALQHVLGTLDPKVPNMGPWEEVALSVEVDEVIDLSAERFDMANDGKKGKEDPKGKSSESDDDDDDQNTDPEQTDSGTGTGQEPEVDDDDRAAEDLGEADDSSEAPEQTGSGVSGTNEGPSEVTEMSNKSGSGGNVIQLSEEEWNAHLQKQEDDRKRTRALEIDLARERFANEAGELIDMGVPPVLVELSRAILERPEAVTVIDLANDNNELNVNDIVRAMLDECKGTIDLGHEQGASYGSETTEDAEQELLAAWEAMG